MQIRQKKYATEAARVKKTVEDLADKYMESAPPFVVDQEKGIMNVFVYNDYIDPVAAFLTAYSVTGSQNIWRRQSRAQCC